MPVTDVTKHSDGRTLTITSEFPAPVERIWQVWADPRQLERWWGPPSHPATVTEHDLTPGGVVRYHMTGPDGETFPGGWRVIAVEPPTRLELEDFFADEEGEPVESAPVSSTVVELSEHDGGTRMVVTAVYPTPEALQQVVDMGMIEGSTAAVSQIDDMLAAEEA